MSTISAAKARAEALFVTDLQPSESRTDDQVRTAVQRAIRQYGSQGCAAQIAAEFGEHPETAIHRMRWAIERIQDAYPQRRRLRRADQRRDPTEVASSDALRLVSAA